MKKYIFLLIPLLLLTTNLFSQESDGFKTVEVSYSSNKHFTDTLTKEESDYKRVISRKGNLIRKDIYYLKNNKLIKREIYNRWHYPAGEWITANHRFKQSSFTYPTKFREYYVDTNICTNVGIHPDSLGEDDEWLLPELDMELGDEDREAVIFKWLAYNVKYPKMAKDEGVSGVTYVQFILEKDMSMSYYSVVRSSHPLLDKAAIDAMKSMQFKKPFSLNGEPVRGCLTLPVRFSLR